MPNHCECDLVIEGEESDLSTFKEFAKEGERILSANPFIPYPERFMVMDQEAREENNLPRWIQLPSRSTAWIWHDRMKDGYNSGGYEWCIENWGTKWDMYDVELIEEDENHLSYLFTCAWSPCIPVIEAMSKKFTSLFFDLRYFERGMQFNGIAVFEDGVLKRKEEGKYFGHRGG